MLLAREVGKEGAARARPFIASRVGHGHEPPIVQVGSAQPVHLVIGDGVARRSGVDAIHRCCVQAKDPAWLMRRTERPVYSEGDVERGVATVLRV